MERVFPSAAAMGKHTWTPTEICEDNAAADNVATPDSDMGPLSDAHHHMMCQIRVGENVVDCSLFDDAPPQSTANGSANAKCRKPTAPGTVASNMDNLI
ncbi:unnamed protein product [Camellia sinensis]